MNQIISIIGTIASVGSIPLALYLFIKSKENTFDRVKRDIIKLLSNHIGSGRQLATFEIQAVINSKLRDNKISLEKLSVDETIEDLIAEVMSNPLIDKEKKEFYLNNFKTIFSKGQLLSYVDSMTSTELTKDSSKEKLNEKVEAIIEKEMETRKYSEIKSKKVDNLASLFGIIGTTITIALSIFIIMSEEILVQPIFDLLNRYQDFSALLMSLFAGVLTLLFASVMRKIINKKNKN